ncbi:histone-like nucleoid-structuring protein Lsr2 [Timonella senegalensis]|uniref:histone-like nucleoid-structuring protein Lsr2 n=1 Tax=Timonella senegalensis TaxID=1465825 RepID=UPI00031FFC78|nr:Lsr2 family protein [Timonella senegalensis]
MAQKVQVILVDDIDGGAADETVTFSLDSVAYEIDLNAAHASELRAALAQYIEAGRKTGRAAAKGGRRTSRVAAGGASALEIREWARANGFEVNERGRISQEIREAYDAAN